MATLTKTSVPSGVGSSSYSSISGSYPITNAYTDSSSTTYAYITCKTGGNAQSYVFLKFNPLGLPSGATIDSVVCKAKARVSSTSYLTTRTLQLYKGDASIARGSATTMSTSTTVYTLSVGTWSASDFDDCYLKVFAQRGTSNTTRGAYIYIYGADITVTYTYQEIKHTVTTSINNGTMISPSEGETEVEEGSSVEFKFRGDENATFESMLVNGTSVEPEYVTVGGNVSWDVSTNYETYQTYALTNAYDGDTSTYWWSSEAQAINKYVLITFETPVTLKSFQTYSSNSTDMPKDNNELQVSEDGETWTTVGTFTNNATTLFSNINIPYVKYARIMAVSSISNWMVINEITIDAEVDVEPYWKYTLSNVLSDVEVVIEFIGDQPVAMLFMKVGNEWIDVTEGIYMKVDGVWTPITPLDIDTTLNYNHITL